MTTTAILNPAEWIPRIRPLLDANWDETGFDFPFNPDAAMYQRLFEAGIAFAVGAFHEDEMIGYCTVCIVPHAHNPSVICASNDALYVHPEFRHGTAAPRLIKAAEDEARRRGAHRFTWHCRAGTRLAETLTQHGYAPVDVVVMKGL